MTIDPKGPHADTADPAAAYTRLHITPFDPELFEVIIPPAVRPRAQGATYHSLQTFPEKRYGFVSLPTAEAEKIKKKLNGAILKGSKVRVEQARTDDMPHPTGEADLVAQEAKKEKKPREKKKRKRGEEQISGVELEEGRKVKRGWTVSEDELKSKRKEHKSKDRRHKSEQDKKERKKKRELKSKYTDGPECLMKVKLPPNKADLANTVEGSGETKLRKKTKSREVVVHEFEKTNKFPTFLKSTEAPSKASKTKEYIDGKGWVDEDGNLVEEVRSTRPAANVQSAPLPQKAAAPVEDDDETSSSGSSSEADSDEEEAEMAAETPLSKPNSAPGPMLTSPPSTTKSEVARPRSSGAMTNLTIKIPPPPTTPAAAKVHPLEALYKRSNPENGAPEARSEAEPFSFFGADDLEDDEDVAPAANQPPMTPYTQEDFEWRNIRSAAPTPDTAHPNKKRIFWAGGDEDDDIVEEAEDEDEGAEDVDMGGNDDDTNVQASTSTTGNAATSATTDFQNWFWENRGDLNRSWKKRRKLASKEKRYRENRSRADRAI